MYSECALAECVFIVCSVVVFLKVRIRKLNFCLTDAYAGKLFVTKVDEFQANIAD